MALLFVGLAAAATGTSLRLDVPASHGAIKGDESTYVAMAMSVAFDSDLAFERQDLARFEEATHSGPEGIFLKLGRRLDLEVTSHWPFVVNDGALEPGTSRVYFGKAWVHAIIAAPFVRAFGINGLVMANALLLVVVLVAAYAFAVTRASPAVALGLSTAFVAATVAPIYVLYLTPEIVNFALVFLALFLWFYKDVALRSFSLVGRWLCHPATDWAGVALLALATFSKPPCLFLIGALCGGRLWQRRPRRALALAVGFALAVGGAFFVNMLATGEANYQGGERKTFYAHFPYDEPGATFESRGLDMATDDPGVGEMFDPVEFWARLRNNTVYFFIGRHFGQLPYHFPGLFIAVLWLMRPREWRGWQVCTALSIATTALALLIYTPFSWSGGGGPLGNRYFLSIYPAYFFLLPSFPSAWTVLTAWAGGLACTAIALLHPLDVAWRPGLVSQHGLPRLLPVELTMVNDLPVMLTADRGRVPYGAPPNDILLYFLDDSAWPPEPDGIWVQAKSRADIIVRSEQPMKRLVINLHSLVPTRVRLSGGGASRVAEVQPHSIVMVVLPITRSVFAHRTYSFVLSVHPENGAMPANIEPGSTDRRYLGTQLQLRPLY